MSFCELNPFSGICFTFFGFSKCKPIISDVWIEFARNDKKRRLVEFVELMQNICEYVPIKRIYPFDGVLHQTLFRLTLTTALISFRIQNTQSNTYKHTHTHNRKPYRLKCIENQFRICDVHAWQCWIISEIHANCGQNKCFILSGYKLLKREPEAKPRFTRRVKERKAHWTHISSKSSENVLPIPVTGYHRVHTVTSASVPAILMPSKVSVSHVYSIFSRDIICCCLNYA